MVIIALATENALRVKVGDATKLRVLANGGTTLGANNTAGTPTDGLYIHGDVLYNGSHTATSDARFKTNIEQIDDALDKIKNIRGVDYNWRTQEFPDRDFSEDRQIGVLAQEIEKEFPELVQTDQDGYKSVDYAKLTPILLEAIKDLTARVEKLEEERTEL